MCIRDRTGYDMDDLLSVGTIGLIKAVNTFNVEKGSRLATYAAKCVENAILSRMRLWFQTSIPRAEKNRDGVFWHRYPRICTVSYTHLNNRQNFEINAKIWKAGTNN